MICDRCGENPASLRLRTRLYLHGHAAAPSRNVNATANLCLPCACRRLDAEVRQAPMTERSPGRVWSVEFTPLPIFDTEVTTDGP